MYPIRYILATQKIGVPHGAPISGHFFVMHPGPDCEVRLEVGEGSIPGWAVKAHWSAALHAASVLALAAPRATAWWNQALVRL